jgi:hypothetical protein
MISIKNSAISFWNEDSQDMVCTNTTINNKYLTLKYQRMPYS